MPRKYSQLSSQCYHTLMWIWHPLHNVPKVVVILYLNCTSKEGGRKAVVPLRNANLLMVYAVLAVLFPEEPMTSPSFVS